MAFFKSRPPANVPAEQAMSAGEDSLDALRVRARRRLIGSLILVLLAVIGFPLVFDHEPRTAAPMNVRVDMPKREAVSPRSPVSPVSESVPAPATPADAQKPQPQNPEAPKAEALKVEAPKAEAQKPPVEAAPASKVAPVKAAQKPEAAADNTPVASEGKPERYVVQIGAFTDAAKIRELRRKLERAGLQTYTQSVKTSDGMRTRVRLGPFASEAQARAALEKAKGLNLTGQLLKL
jgi:DedD protein